MAWVSSAFGFVTVSVRDCRGGRLLLREMERFVLGWVKGRWFSVLMSFV